MTKHVALLAVLMTTWAVAQTPAPAFEVASIRANKIGGAGKKVGDAPTPVGTGGVMTPQGNRWTARNATVRTLIRFAYGSDGDVSTPALLEEYRVAGGPSWIASEAFDIEARMPEAPRVTGDTALMLRALLAERFALKVHTETRELPAYALVRARSDGMWGDGMRRTSGLCVSGSERVNRDQRACGVRGGFQGIMGDGVAMTGLVVALSPIVGRPVVDRTGFDGAFDFTLRFTTEPTTDSRFPLIFTALQEQLGLKLESGRASVEVLVIDRVERPTEN